MIERHWDYIAADCGAENNVWLRLVEGPAIGQGVPTPRPPDER